MKLYHRIAWAKANLAPVKPRYRILYRNPWDDSVSMVIPAPEWLAMALHGDLLPPVDVYHQLVCEWTHADGRVIHMAINENPGAGWKHGTVTNGQLLHDTPPAPAMTEEEAMTYLLQKDVPRCVWYDYERANEQRFLICTKEQLPATRAFREHWRMTSPQLRIAA